MFGDILKGIIGPIIGPLLDRIPDPNARAQAKEAVEAQMLNAMTGLVAQQIEVNKVEATHASIFVSGWRPAVGWICGAGMAWAFIVHPFILWFAFLAQVDIGNAPSLDSGELMTILMGMLGLGGLRTYEKRLGVSRTGTVPK